ncbi:hypothetical protein P7B02_05160 [Caulobacter segnis]|uniref:hypothetical protein n=1 Tax=Caulobacter segnis TaxID=88688 RepID=UPI002410B26C|nr:hypothetical protein [Caulobacter segnis]MDG2520926.1 hypothetical protein [Caulobacter segnis]
MTEAEPEVLPKSIIAWQPTHGVGLHRGAVTNATSETAIAIGVGALALAAVAVGAFLLGRSTAGKSFDDFDPRDLVRRWI